MAASVIMAAVGLVISTRSLPRSGEVIVPAPELSLDVNTAPPHVLGTLPHVGQALVRELVAARERQPIVSLDDAGSRVRGLGPATLAQIAPYLRFEPSPQPGGNDSLVSLVDQPAEKSRDKRRKTPTRVRKPKSSQLQPRLASHSPELEPR